MYRPDIGYVQGMSYLAGNLLLYLAPYEAFVAFAHLINSPFFHAFLKLDHKLMQERYSIFQQCMQDNEPELAKHLQQEGIAPDLFFMEWCMTLYRSATHTHRRGRVNTEAQPYSSVFLLLLAGVVVLSPCVCFVCVLCVCVLVVQQASSSGRGGSRVGPVPADGRRGGVSRGGVHTEGAEEERIRHRTYTL